MNEAETRAEYIDPKLKASGWGEIEGSKVLREYHITEGRINVGAPRGKAEIADYVLVYKNTKLAVIEAKQVDLSVGEGAAQAKTYAEKLTIDYTYSTNGKEIYEISMKTGKEGIVDRFPTPEELWNKTYSDHNNWKDVFSSIPLEGDYGKRYYQEIAISKTVSAVAEDKKRILLTMATGTGKTAVAFQVAWKLFQARWTLQKDGKRRPRILFLADRNILADQAFNAFSLFPQDALVRVNPLDIRRRGGVPMSGSIYFTIFQTFMSGKNNTPYFGEYPNDFFDFIIIDECHRGGANDEGNWRGILEYFAPAVQLGLTATPKRQDNIDTYEYFGEPIYIYSLKQGINDGFLTPFRVKRVQTTLDEYIFTPDDHVVEGEVEQGKVYEEEDFNKIIEIKEREEKRVKIVLDEIDQSQKTIIFCANQLHALVVRDLVNQNKISKDPFYCARVTANDGARGEERLREFQDNEKTIPTILTTSQKLSTGVDARNIRNIVLMRPVNSMIEFKQIIGRGTRLFDGKEYFTIYDFVGAYKHFADSTWDGEPIDPIEPIPPTVQEPTGTYTTRKGTTTGVDDEKGILKIKLRDGKDREIKHMISTSFWSVEGKPISIEEFMNNLFGVMPEFFQSEEELRKIWSNPITRKKLLDALAEKGYGSDELETIQKMIDAENSDIYDVLAYISFLSQPVSREERVEKNKKDILVNLNTEQKDFITFVLTKYKEQGIEELNEEKLPVLLNLKYKSSVDAINTLGEVDSIRSVFFGFQEKLFQKI